MTFITTSLCVQIERVADEIPSTELAWSRAGSNTFFQLDPLPNPRLFELLSFYVYRRDSISTNYPFASFKVIASARSSSNACATHSLHRADFGWRFSDDTANRYTRSLPAYEHSSPIRSAHSILCVISFHNSRGIIICHARADTCDRAFAKLSNLGIVAGGH
jgi:hypothetical protein